MIIELHSYPFIVSTLLSFLLWIFCFESGVHRGRRGRHVRGARQRTADGDAVVAQEERLRLVWRGDGPRPSRSSAPYVEPMHRSDGISCPTGRIVLPQLLLHIECILLILHGRLPDVLEVGAFLVGPAQLEGLVGAVAAASV